MSKTFKSRDRKRTLLLLLCLPERLPLGRLPHSIVVMVEQLDLSVIYIPYGGDGRVRPLYDPPMIVSLLFYAYSIGVVSSHKIEKRAHDDIALRMIASNRHPDHHSIFDFRKERFQALVALFVQILRICNETMRRKLIAKANQAIYAGRKFNVEYVFGRIKEMIGMRQFLLRGKENVAAECGIGALHIISSSSTAMKAPPPPQEGAFFVMDEITSGQAPR